MYTTDIRGGLDYAPCHYGKSRNTYRGPKPSLDGGYIACLGGTETFGRFLPDPWPLQLGDRLGFPVANFGQANAGLDLYLNDRVVMGVAAGAEACAMQVLGAANMSNRFYTVHPRRNDRFVKASEALRDLYPEVDFTQVAFTGALLQMLLDTCPERFERVVRELQTAWVSRMKTILGGLPRPVPLLWMGEAPPPETVVPEAGLPRDAAFVTREMLEALGPRIAGVVEVIEPPAARSTVGMVFTEFDAMIAASLSGLAARARAAEELAAELTDILARG